MTEPAVREKRPRIDHPEELDRLVRQIVERIAPVARTIDVNVVEERLAARTGGGEGTGRR